jgi:hypothetical protein
VNAAIASNVSGGSDSGIEGRFFTIPRLVDSDQPLPLEDYMQEERNTPKDEDAEEVEAHTRPHGRSEEDMDEGSDDEVEAHTRRSSPEGRAWNPEQ